MTSSGGSSSGSHSSSSGGTRKPQCNDGIDNDGDGAIDFPADFGCSNARENNENRITVLEQRNRFNIF